MEQFDIISVIVFVLIGIMGAYFIGNAQRVGMLEGSANHRVNKKRISYYSCFFVVFVLFATFREVGHGTGGSDAINYIRYFLHCRDKTINLTEIISEPLWHYFNLIIRFFTSNYHVFFFVCYGLIVVCFLLFIKNYSPERIIYSPLILLVWPYLKDFNTLRTGVAVAVFLLGLIRIEKNKLISFVLIVASVFIHRMSVLFVPIWFFYYLYRKHLHKLTGIRLLFFYLFFIIVTYGLSAFMQTYIVYNQILSGNDAYYISMGIGQNILLRWPMFFAQLCLLALMLLFNKSIRNNEQLNTLRVFAAYDFITIPASLVLGMWRANEYLYIVRLLMWGEIIRIILARFNGKSKWLVKMFFTVLFIAWLVFRLYQECEEIDIMPYVFRITNDWRY